LAQAGNGLGLGADVVLSSGFPKIDHIKAGEIQEIDGNGGRRKEQMVVLLTSIP